MTNMCMARYLYQKCLTLLRPPHCTGLAPRLVSSSDDLEKDTLQPFCRLLRISSPTTTTMVASFLIPKRTLTESWTKTDFQYYLRHWFMHYSLRLCILFISLSCDAQFSTLWLISPASMFVISLPISTVLRSGIIYPTFSYVMPSAHRSTPILPTLLLTSSIFIPLFSSAHNTSHFLPALTFLPSSPFPLLLLLLPAPFLSLFPSESSSALLVFSVLPYAGWFRRWQSIRVFFSCEQRVWRGFNDYKRGFGNGIGGVECSGTWILLLLGLYGAVIMGRAWHR